MTDASPACDPDANDTLLYLYGPNACTPQVAFSDDDGPGLYSQITYTPTVSGTYYIMVRGYSSNEGCYMLSITCAGVPPTILVDEVEPNDTCGAAVQTLTCDNFVYGRAGLPPVLGACCVPGCGTCTLTTQTACVSPNVWHGEWTSCTPNQCPVTTPPPANDTCAGAILIPCGTGVIQSSLSCASPDYSPPSVTTCTGYTAVGPDVAYMMNLQAGQVVTLTMDPTPDFDCSIYIVTDCANMATCLGGADDNVTLPDAETITAWTAPAAGTYYVICDKYSIAAGDGFTLTYDISCPAVTAACCAQSGICTVTTEAECLVPSVWHSEWATCEVASCPEPPAEGACCFADGHCELLSLDACLVAPDHVNWVGGVICDPAANPCAQPGACCDPATGACSFVLAQFCVAPLVFHAELTCLPNNPCPLPTGACCTPAGGCAVMTQAECLTPNTWHPEWTCTPNNCPPPVPTDRTTWGKIKANYR